MHLLTPKQQAAIQQYKKKYHLDHEKQTDSIDELKHGPLMCEVQHHPLLPHRVFQDQWGDFWVMTNSVLADVWQDHPIKTERTDLNGKIQPPHLRPTNPLWWPKRDGVIWQIYPVNAQKPTEEAVFLLTCYDMPQGEYVVPQAQLFELIAVASQMLAHMTSPLI